MDAEEDAPTEVRGPTSRISGLNAVTLRQKCPACFDAEQHAPFLSEKKNKQENLGLGIDLVPHTAGQVLELLRIDIHLEEPRTQHIALLRHVVDVVDQTLVVLLQLRRILVLVLVRVRLGTRRAN